MKTYKLASLIIAALFAVVIYPAVSAESKPIGLSVEALGVVRHQDLNFDKGAYGVGVDVGYAFNKFVKAHVRAIGYESPDEWRGSVVDEGSALIEATLLGSDNKRVKLSAIGGADRDFVADDWGFSIGARVGFKIFGPISMGAESRIRAWIKQEKDLISTVFLQYSF